MTGLSRRLGWLLLAGLAVCAAPARAADVGDPAPELVGIDSWINSEPRTLASLRGQVVLVNFWTLACSNCIATLPHVEAWHERFAARGLVILGVHTPELEFERPRAKVEASVRGRGIAYPVALDLDSATWNAWGNHAWPAFYFVDKRGVIRHVHFGEGEYDESERWLEKLLAE
jgi:thiol-disulfide isomerase/thioredoxin